MYISYSLEILSAHQRVKVRELLQIRNQSNLVQLGISQTYLHQELLLNNTFY